MDIYFLQFWRIDVQDQSAGRAGFFRGFPPGLQMAVFSRGPPSRHVWVKCSPLVSIPSVSIWGHPEDLSLKYVPLSKPVFVTFLITGMKYMIPDKSKEERFLWCVEVFTGLSSCTI